MDPIFDVNALIGETYEYAPRTVLPESYYPVVLRVVGVGSSDPKEVALVDKDKNPQHDELGNVIMVPGGEWPFIELGCDVYEGPFAGETVTRKMHVAPGKSGGGLPKWLGATKAITRQQAQTAAACQQFGIPLPTAAQIKPVGKETPDQAARRILRASIGEAFIEMDAAKRLAFSSALLMFPAWDGKRVIVKLKLETQKAKQPNQDGTDRWFSNNDIDGFLPVDDEKKGLAWVRAVEFPKQEATKAAMEARAAEIGS